MRNGADELMVEKDPLHTNGNTATLFDDVAVQLKTAFDLSTDFLALHASNGKIIYANGAARKMIEFDENATSWPYRPAIAAALSEFIVPNLVGNDPWVGDIDLRDDFGVARVLSVSVTRASEDAEAAILVMARDVTVRRTVERDNQIRTFTDELTTLPNRAAVNKHLDDLFVTARPGGTVAAVLVDLDRFKSINDTLGHHFGDEMLMAMSARLQTVMRPGEMLARLGSDEFVVVIDGPDIDAVAKRAVTIARSSVEMLSAPIVLDNNTIYISASVGYASHEGTAVSGEASSALLRHADLAMHRAKTTGRNRAVAFSEDLAQEAHRSLHIESSLHHAIEANELVVVYQPISHIDADGPRLRGFEALVRWVDENGSLQAPGEFLDVAEQSDLITHIDTFVLQSACRDISRWTSMWPEMANITVAVNVSSRQLSRCDLAEVVERALEQSGLEPHRLILEVTETNLMADMDAALTSLKEMRRIGVRIAIDDFGTGYCSMSYLRLFKADTVKIDRSFVNFMTENPEDSQVIRAITQLATTFGMDTIAEGVETNAQLSMLRSIGCDAAQGYFLDRPLQSLQVEARFAVDGSWTFTASDVNAR
jgi:diguanylate cyclase (GGDEF)-like protein